MTDPELEVKNLKVTFFTLNGEPMAVNGIDYFLQQVKNLALVGESGCGKIVSVLSILRLISQPPGKIFSGEI